MDDFVLLGLLAVVAFLLGPIAFFLTLGARSRLKIVEAKLAALTTPAPLAESKTSASRSPDIAAAAPAPPRPDIESADEGMEQIRLALLKADAPPTPPSLGAPDEAAPTPTPTPSEPATERAAPPEPATPAGAGAPPPAAAAR